MTDYRKKLIEVALPLAAISTASAVEKSVPRRGHPQGIHLWWARRPLAAARAILFAQFVDDPSGWPEIFPTEASQDAERQRLFGIVSELCKWENSDNDAVLGMARLEIARSLARGRLRVEGNDDRDQAVLANDVDTKVIDTYLAEVAPPVHDPFAGGGTIPIEAQRLGLRAIASDLNPVAVLINKALVEIPSRFKGSSPVGPRDSNEKQSSLMVKSWQGSAGIAEDVRRYGAWVRAEALNRIGNLYGKVKLPDDLGGGQTPIVAWLWSRTVESPNPAFRGVYVPLAASFWLSKKKGAQSWIVPVFSNDRRSYHFEINHGDGAPEVAETVNRKGAVCLASGDPIPFTHIREQAKSGRLGARLMAIAVQVGRRRVFLPASDDMESTAHSAKPSWFPDTQLPDKALGFRVQEYGMTRHADLFTQRQLVALGTIADLVAEARGRVISDAIEAGWSDDDVGLDDGGRGARAYADAISIYLSLGLGRTADYNSTIATWNIIGRSIRSTFARHALPMTWDFYETNPLSDTTGSWDSCLKWVYQAIAKVPARLEADVRQADACTSEIEEGAVVSTDPPYYDNIGYADLSDFFYVWLRRALHGVELRALGTMLVPKSDELVATPYRHGGRRAAEVFFLKGMSSLDFHAPPPA